MEAPRTRTLAPTLNAYSPSLPDFLPDWQAHLDGIERRWEALQFSRAALTMR